MALDDTATKICFAIAFAIYYSLLYRLLVPYLERLSGMTPQKSSKAFSCFCFDFMSITHAVCAFIISTAVLVGTNFTLNGPNNDAHTLVIVHSLGYFIFDTLHEAAFAGLLQDTMMLVHHVLALTPLAYMVTQSYGGAEIAIALFLAECSNPFILIRNLYKHAAWPTESLFYKINELVFAFSFIVTRALLSPFALYFTYTGSNVPLMLKLMCSGLTFISFLWVIKIINLLWKRIGDLVDSKGAPGWWVNGDIFLQRYLRKGLVQRGVMAITFGAVVVYPLLWEFCLK